MDLKMDIDKLCENLEKQELEAANGVPSVKVYSQLLALYLCKNDLCNAKYLWKRIPSFSKKSCQDLEDVWKVGQHLWKRNYASTLQCLKQTKWSTDLAQIMDYLTDEITKRCIDLISNAYSNVYVDTIKSLSGFTNEEIQTYLVNQRNWMIQENVCYPVPIKSPIYMLASNENQLSKLTEFVSFLEN